MGQQPNAQRATGSGLALVANSVAELQARSILSAVMLTCKNKSTRAASGPGEYFNSA